MAWSRWCDTRRRKGEATGNTNFDLNRRASLRPYLRRAEGATPSVYVMDWSSRAILSWRLSNTMDTSFCVEALEEALARFDKPEIFNTD